ncbi:DNA topoisomerase (ATP-hydrolyzing) subunit B [Mesomycoplasma lagogenitalium]|uniref:DNA gyrase subunit B n=2 Tax=Mesomycoplasma lagogenitalium TaxID=171286 RepID=A0ABY8LVP7_9BACT|nr:DNA topoisomerase (ATP-hydrolyzing) subunit B [Mesomycoplasma lagogenitalium]WGI36496.1 DNA topoisomerase (ATP-hydrolyzing) subunit B [Mesomycoplasma lagogenitalium]
MSNEYGASSIQSLEGLEAVRKRPGMYVGGTGILALHHLIWEIVDNSVDESLAGFANEISITITKDGYAKISDNGRGIPTDIHPKHGVSAAEVVLTILHAGGKFDSNAYKVSGGLHGVGASVVNALSSNLKVWIKREGKIHFQEFIDGGKKVDDLKVIGECPIDETGTTIMFKPDFTIMEQHEFKIDTIIDRIKQTAYLTKGLKFLIFDERSNIKKEFCFEGGIIDYISELTKGYEKITEKSIYAEGIFNLGEEKSTDISVEVALQYVQEDREEILTYANNIYNKEGGTHETGLFDSLSRILNNYAMDNKFIKSDTDKFSRDDLKEGMFVVISIKHSDPMFEGQTKGKLINKDVRPAVNKVFSEVFERFLNENPGEARKIIERNLLAQKARRAAASAREATKRKGPFEIGSLPGKLADCSTKNAEIAELYIVEGNSAGGSAKMGRDRHYQAILPLRGKVINSQKTSDEKLFKNEEILSLITAFGTGVGSEFNINKLRYHKIVIMTDADVDGAHIRTLLLTFFYRYFRPLIEYGFIYIAQPPLYKISYGKKDEYAYNDQQKEEILSRIGDVKVTIQRYKGLGEMDPSQLWETTMDPVARKMLQVQIEDAMIASQVFEQLMGEEVAPRREFIEENAKFVKNIDL